LPQQFTLVELAMGDAYRRYEVLLPLQFNDGSPVPEQLIADSLHELKQKFGAVSRESQTIEGRGTHQGHTYSDELVRIFVDVPDLPVNRQFFQDFKQRLKSRFGQLEIWVTTHPLEVL
jgi:hypothetical protein